MYRFAGEIIDSEVAAGVRQVPRLTDLELISTPLREARMYGFVLEISDSEVPAAVWQFPRLTDWTLGPPPSKRRECMGLLRKSLILRCQLMSGNFLG